jgi:hypothetical protein
VAGLGVVVSGRLTAGPLLSDHRLEHDRCLVDDGSVGEGSLEGDDPRPFEERSCQFRLHGASRTGVGDDGTEMIAVVDDRVLVDGRSVWVVGEFRRLFDDGHHVGEAAIGLVQPTSGDVGVHGCHGPKCSLIGALYL